MASTATNLLSRVPKGTYQIKLSPSLRNLLPSKDGKKRKRNTNDDDEEDEESEKNRKIIAMKFGFKPASITSSIPGEFNSEEKILSYEVAGGAKHVFEAKEVKLESRECVLIWDKESQSYTLHPVFKSYTMTHDRNLSAAAASGSGSASSATRNLSPTKSSVTSSIQPSTKTPSVSTAAVPARALTPVPSAIAPLVSKSDTAPRTKKHRPSDINVPARGLSPSIASSPVSASARSMTGGKSLPRKTIPSPLIAPEVVAPTLGKKSKAITKAMKVTTKATGGKGPSGGTTKKNVVESVKDTGKYKSKEIIEDSDDDVEEGDDDGDGDGDGYAGDEEGGDDGRAKPTLDDEFAAMLGESLAASDKEEEEEDEEESEEESDEEDEGDDELGGATLVGGSSSYIDDHSEWL